MGDFESQITWTSAQDLSDDRSSGDSDDAPGHNGDLLRRLIAGDYRGLISLWDMLHYTGLEFADLFGQLERLRCKVQTEMDEWARRGEGEPLAYDPAHPNYHEFEFIAKLARRICNLVGLDVAGRKARFLSTGVDALREKGSRIRGQTMLAELKELGGRLKDEARSRQFLYVPPERAAYYGQARLFGDDVADKFPSAGKDIEEAGNCLALGRNTASACHSMRALEYGLDAIAFALKVPKQQDWGSYIREIDKAIGAALKPMATMNTPKMSARKRATARARRDYFSEVSMRFQAVKDACRNKTMHVEKTYEWAEAEEVLKATCSLMQQIAKRCRERPGRR